MARRFGPDLDLEDDRPAGAKSLGDVNGDGVDRPAFLGRPTEPKTGLLADRPSSEALRRAPPGPGYDVALRTAKRQRTVEHREARRDLGREERFNIVGSHSAPGKIVDGEAFIRGEQAVQTQPQHAESALLAIRPRQQPTAHDEDFRL